MIEMKSVEKQKLPYYDCITRFTEFQINDTLKCLLEFISSGKFKKWSRLIKAAFFFELGETYSRLSHFYDALQAYLDSYTLYEKIPKKTKNILADQASLSYFITHVLLEIGDFSQAKEYSNIALELYTSINDKEGLSHVYDVKSLIEMVNFNFKVSLDLAFQSLKIRSEYNSDSVKISYNNIGELFRYEGLYKNALEYYEKAKACYKQNDSDLINYAFVLNNIGVVYSKMGDVEFAFKNFSQSQDIFYLLDIFDPECVLDFTAAMIEGLKKVNKSEFENFTQKIENNFLEISKRVLSVRSHALMIQFLTTKGDYYLQRNDFYLSQEYYLAALEISDFTNYPSKSILIRAKLINRSLHVIKSGNTLFCKRNAEEWLEEAKTIAFQNLISPLIIELEFLESILHLNKSEFKQANEILRKIKGFATKTGNQELVDRVEKEFGKIQRIENKKDSKIHIDIVDYVSTISRFVRD